MSEYQGEDSLSVGDIPLMNIVEDVISELGWRIMERGDDWIFVKEKDRFDYYNPLEMRIEFIRKETSRVKILVNASNAGYGPVQDEYIKSQVTRFINSVRILTEGTDNDLENGELDNDHSLSSELHSLAILFEEGKLTDEEYRKAKEKVLKV